jgi:hypothetical protein
MAARATPPRRVNEAVTGAINSGSVDESWIRDARMVGSFGDKLLFRLPQSDPNVNLLV